MLGAGRAFGRGGVGPAGCALGLGGPGGVLASGFGGIADGLAAGCDFVTASERGGPGRGGAVLARTGVALEGWPVLVGPADGGMLFVVSGAPTG